jgi:hypothetical protein
MIHDIKQESHAMRSAWGLAVEESSYKPAVQVISFHLCVEPVWSIIHFQATCLRESVSRTMQDLSYKG